MSSLFKLIYRNYLKFKTLNTLNITGLSLGFVAAFLMVLYVDHEISFDAFHNEANQIFRLEAQTNSETWHASLGHETAAQLSTESFPEIEHLVMYDRKERAFVQVGDIKIPEKNAFHTAVESAFFEVFNFKFLDGDAQTALQKPYSAVLTKSTAERYFGKDRAIGQTLRYDSTAYTVTAVLADLPTNTHFNFNMLLTDPEFFSRDHFHVQTFVRLNETSNRESLSKKILDLDIDYGNEWHQLTKVRLMALGDIHLYSDTSFGAGGKGDLMQLGIFVALAFLILGIAVINYVNMTFAIFVNKGKEIGVRKVLGENTGSIVLKLALQAMLTISISIPVILVLTYMAIPAFNDFMGVDLWFVLQEKLYYVFAGFLFLVMVSLLTVVYPTLTINKIEISTLIKSKLLLSQSGGVRYRNVLTLFQFALLFTLGLSAWFMNRQIEYLDQKDKGFDPEGVIKIENAYELGEIGDYQILKTNLLRYPQLKGVAFGPMMGDGMSPLSYQPEGSSEVYENLLSYGVDIDYFDVMGIDILNGSFKETLTNSEDGQITSLVNQTFIRRYNWQDDPIGKKIILRPGTENELHRKVSAVFEDFHFYSFKEKISPQIISLRPDPRFINTNILVKSTEAGLRETKKIIEKEWLKINQTVPVNIVEMREAVEELYEKEKQTGTLGISLSILAIILSAMGLLGFIWYMLSLKSKEIAIRKVLGATLLQIVNLLNRQLFITIMVAGFVGSIASFWMIRQWLQDYAYAINVTPVTFIVALLLVYVAVFGAIAVQTFRSALIDPVIVLKEE